MDSVESCGTDQNQHEAGKTLHCPSGSNCDTCTLECEGRDACNGAIIHGYNCTELVVNLIDGATVGRALTIYAPDNGGNLRLKDKVPHDNSAFRDGRIYAAPNTNNITVDIYFGSSTEHEARDALVNGTTANYVEFNCYDAVHCTNIDLYCPIASKTVYHNGGSTTACVVNCTDTDICTVNAFIAGGSWDDDVTFFCNGVTDCSEMTVYCNNGSESCEMSATNTCDGGNRQCQPTPAPTYHPSNNPIPYPTDTPTNDPTNKPTNIPTSNPTNTPTVEPTNDPTKKPNANPTSNPTDSPSHTPVHIPSSIPIESPTNEPVALPTVPPSDHDGSTDLPSNIPSSIASKNPYHSPTNYPSDFATTLSRIPISSTHILNSSTSTTALPLATEIAEKSHDSSQVDGLLDTAVYSSFIFGGFLLVGVCGYIDAKFCRRNEIFSMSAFVCAATYTADMISGIVCL